MLLSVVIPAYNESAGINTFYKDHLLPALEAVAKKNYEVIFVNDGSSDNTLTLLKKIADQNPRVRIVNLSRNFGKEIAVTAGVSVAMGEATIIMDSDGQHPPTEIHNFIDKWKSGARVVVGVRTENHKEGPVKKFGSKLFYWFFNRISTSKLTPKSTDFRLIDESVRVEFLRLTEKNRITRGLIDWLGFERDYVYFSAPARLAGEASYRTSQLVKLALNSIVSLSLKPLFFFGWVGLVMMLLSVIMGLFIIIEQVLLGDPMNLNVTGTAILVIITTFLVSLVLMSQAMIAIYMSHIYDQSQNRPLFIIDRENSVNLQDAHSK